MLEGKIILISGPSGTGKTTITHRLKNELSVLSFSISATTRSPRGKEINGVDYYFFSKSDFEKGLKDNLFIEHQEVYEGMYYGTLRKEVERIWENNKIPLLDIDVMGALNIKKQFQNNALTLFIHPVSIEILENRLRNRATDNEEIIQKRMKRAQLELAQAPKFDYTFYNDDLEATTIEVIKTVQSFLD